MSNPDLNKPAIPDQLSQQLERLSPDMLVALGHMASELFNAQALLEESRRQHTDTAEELATLKAELAAKEEAMGIEPKTGLLTAEKFKEKILEATARTNRATDQFGVGALLLLDIDKFKEVNKLLGYTGADDEVLKPVADKIKNVTRDDTLAARWGGEEFVIFLPDITSEDAGKVAQRLLDDVNGIKLEHTINGRDHVGISVGIAEFEQGADYNAVFKDANDKLTYAKEHGRNQIVSEIPAVQTIPMQAGPGPLN